MFDLQGTPPSTLGITASAIHIPQIQPLEPPIRAIKSSEELRVVFARAAREKDNERRSVEVEREQVSVWMRLGVI